jgi:hypothetical protein
LDKKTHLITSIIPLILRTNNVNRLNTRVTLNSRRIAIVTINPDKRAAPLDSRNALDGDVPLVHLVAVPARSVQFAEVVHSEAGDADCASTIMLNNFVLCALGAAADYGEGSGAGFEGESVF